MSGGVSLSITETTGPIGGRGHDGRDREQASPGGRYRDGPIGSLLELARFASQLVNRMHRTSMKRDE
jgi:hypothetical protein